MARASKFRLKFEIITFSCVIYCKNPNLHICCTMTVNCKFWKLETSWNVFLHILAYIVLHPYGTYFRKYVPYGCKTMYARMCRKTFHDVSSFQNLQFTVMVQQICKFGFLQYITQENVIISNFSRNFDARAMNYFFSEIAIWMQNFLHAQNFHKPSQYVQSFFGS